MMNPIFMLISMLCTLLFWVIIISVVVSWLVAFNVLKPHNNAFIARAYAFLNSFTERLYAPIRKVIPTIYGGMDISPVIVIIAIQLIQYTLIWLSVRFGI